MHLCSTCHNNHGDIRTPNFIIYYLHPVDRISTRTWPAGSNSGARKFLIFRILIGFSSQYEYRYRISTGTPVKIRVYSTVCVLHTCLLDVHSCVCIHMLNLVPRCTPRYLSLGTSERESLRFLGMLLGSTQSVEYVCFYH